MSDVAKIKQNKAIHFKFVRKFNKHKKILNFMAIVSWSRLFRVDILLLFNGWQLLIKNGCRFERDEFTKVYLLYT